MRYGKISPTNHVTFCGLLDDQLNWKNSKTYLTQQNPDRTHVNTRAGMQMRVRKAHYYFPFGNAVVFRACHCRTAPRGASESAKWRPRDCGCIHAKNVRNVHSFLTLATAISADQAERIRFNYALSSCAWTNS